MGLKERKKELSPNTLASGAWRHPRGGANLAVSWASPEPQEEGMPLGLAKSQLPLPLLGKGLPVSHASALRKALQS